MFDEQFVSNIFLFQKRLQRCFCVAFFVTSCSFEAMSVFGFRLRCARQSLGLTQEDVGLAIGIDKSSCRARISRYEAGVSEPALLISQRLAKSLNVPLSYLYCEDDLQAEILLVFHRLSKDQLQKIAEVMRAYP